ncbi:MAG: type I-E CRISPR-associated protein Cas6/Cse3/CasE [Ruminobacter sp.]|uniref:type I-E CRISPR-associated protein Cas6/Cse3/CasE n=1 Tax=Ruminobacter sp. TaxID=2774296 RepID=UPI001B43622B|nr:type I-E CRISPR-associated protein Cas6/Cse3/CasE [Ruminobacter sp.]MBP3748711.1 type I-E CRISPR-associated protein Cas6/Cse3/CasE [Ruminobacter sp.]
MYLSRVEIDIGNRQKLRDLSHLGAYHNWVENSFPHEIENGIRSRKLWRIDTIQGTRFLLLVSDEKPDLKLLEQYGVSGSARTKSYDKFLESIEENKFYRFRVTLNPVKAIHQEDGKRGRVVPEITTEQQMKFFESRAEKLGFELVPNDYLIVEKSWVPMKKQGQKTIKLSRATFEGILKVTDKTVFYHSLTKGIGKKKAYGFGLMTVIPV